MLANFKNSLWFYKKCEDKLCFCSTMESVLLWSLVVVMMFAGTNGIATSKSCTMVNGQMECTSQSSNGNMAGASSGAFSNVLQVGTCLLVPSLLSHRFLSTLSPSLEEVSLSEDDKDLTEGVNLHSWKMLDENTFHRAFVEVRTSALVKKCVDTYGAMESAVIWSLVIAMMIAATHSRSSSRSCSTINGVTQCTSESSDGNFAGASSGAFSNGQSSYQQTSAATGDTFSGASSSSSSSSGNFDPFAFAGLPNPFNLFGGGGAQAFAFGRR
ncbi:hypothetical protein JTE90_008082 [Oedothorax gibbosus]|uniref:Uncharacterized protein n=1 Tax=Oedothorax gibbosus TaxID=931172 RepID=A0AAV6UVX4_9ARAC|nr:hypothetical protein JTE90_008082 [Oedothorax gibbosus]